METSIEGDTFFVLGLGAFLLGHVAYVLACLRDGASLSDAPRRFVLGFGAYAVAIVVALWADLPADLRVPVVVYACAIALMGVAALARRYLTRAKGRHMTAWGAVSERSPRRAPRARRLGAVLFVASDTILAVDRFPYQGRLPLGHEAVLASYYMAQYLIYRSTLAPPQRTRVVG